MSILAKIYINEVLTDTVDITNLSPNAFVDYRHPLTDNDVVRVEVVSTEGDVPDIQEYYISAIDTDYVQLTPAPPPGPPSTPPPPPPGPPSTPPPGPPSTPPPPPPPSSPWPTDPAGPVTMGVKLFASVGDMANNARRQVARVGELSTYSETFSRDRELSSGAFVLDPLDPNSLSQGLHQTVFSAKTITGDTVDLRSEYLDLLEEISEWIYRNGMAAAFDNQSETVRQQLMAEFQTPLYNLEIGTMVQAGDGNWFPESMVFTLTAGGINSWYVAKTSNQIVLDGNYDRSLVKIWFSDRAFQAQYDEYEIDFVAPIDTLDDFFRTASAVQGLVGARTIPVLMNKVALVADSDPYTEVKSMEFDWYDPLTAGHRIRTVWTFVIYGAAGLSVDAMKEGLRNWILDHSTHTREEWTAIFPDIFKSTEFIFMPTWNRYAIPNMTLSEGVYSPILDYQDALISAQKVVCGIGYTTDHLVNRLAFFGTPYKSVAMVVCGGPENRASALAINQVWPDYLSVVTSSVDFNRMQPQTQTWVNVLQTLLSLAENASEFSEIPVGYSRIRRKNPANQQVTYIATTIDNIQYMVVSKASMQAIVPVADYGVTPQDMPLSLLPETDLPLETVQGSKKLTVDFEAIGGVGPYTYSLDVTSGMQAQAIGPASGQCEITFNAYGDQAITVRVTDAVGTQYRGDYVVHVRP